MRNGADGRPINLERRHRAERREIEKAINRLRDLEEFYAEDVQMAQLFRLERQRLTRRLQFVRSVDE